MAAALDAAEFARRMAPLGPFEPEPDLAVAVSGGADSLALALLAAGWVAARGGRLTALTVNHRLRPDSAAEAAQVGAWLAARGIAHAVLVWDGPKPAADVQAAARIARYRLLEEWCARHGVLHLLLAHHRDDLAETFLLRLGRGSGLDGLAAMAAVQETRSLRLLRPLLEVAPPRLRATLADQGQDWIEDPSNRNPAFARVRLRGLGPVLAAEGLTPARLAATARRLGRARAVVETALAEAALRHVRLEPAGYALVERAAFCQLPDEVGLRLLSRLVMAVGGGAYPPRLERVEAAYAALRRTARVDRTLAGCRLADLDDGPLCICREAARMAAPVPLPPGEVVTWDGRFRVAVAADAPPGLTLGGLGQQGWRPVAAARDRALPPIPAPARATLPAISGQDGVSAVPHLGYNRDGGTDRALRWIVPASAGPLAVAGRCLV